MGSAAPPSAMPSVADPLAEALAEDLPGTFERVVLTYQDRLFTFALRLCGDRRDAEEVAQDAFIRAYRALLTYDVERVRALALRPWLYQITLNLSRNRLRGRTQATLPLPEDHTDEMYVATASPLQAREEHGPEQTAERAELSARLVAALDTLPPRYRTAIVLRHVTGHSYPELAATLAAPTGTVKAQVHRGIALLRAAWDGQATPSVHHKEHDDD
jgi:RNA polymerase sigma-70 factor (ECF subfamily)